LFLKKTAAAGTEGFHGNLGALFTMKRGPPLLKRFSSFRCGQHP